MTIWVDADACPRVIKDLIFKTAERLKIKTILVANNFMDFPSSDYISLEVVNKGFNEADQYIIDHCTLGDLVISADIPLAQALVKKAILVIDPRGRVYTEENISDVSSARDLMQELRSGGMIQGGPQAFGSKEKEAFANAFNKELTRMLKK